MHVSNIYNTCIYPTMKLKTRKYLNRKNVPKIGEVLFYFNNSTDIRCRKVMSYNTNMESWNMSMQPEEIPTHITSCLPFNPLMPNGAFNICCPRDCVSRTANVERTVRHEWVKWDRAEAFCTAHFIVQV